MESNMWTPMMRDEFISKALNSEDDRGNQGYYWFNVMPKNVAPDEENPKKALVTKALMNTILENPNYRIFALKIYDILINKVTSNPYTRQHYQTNFVIQVKGGSSYMYLLGKTDDEMFPHSDMDIVIYINPHMPEYAFNQLKDTLSTIVQQSISQYKRCIDFMFFSNKERMSKDQINKQACEQFLSDDLISAFKEDYNEALSKISGDEGTFVSPFEGNEFRNAASKHSFIIENSNVKQDAVVRVEVPHFPMCERIPLRKSPLFCSSNKSIRFNRVSADKGEMIGAFDLFRIRFNNLFMFKDVEEDKMYRESITADFIDISIACQDDAELHDFWANGRMIVVNDVVANMWITMPDIQTMLRDLYKMIHVYECPESKKEKRIKRYKALERMFQDMAFGA